MRNLAGQPITADVPYMVQRQLEEEVDADIYEKIEEMSARIGDLPPIARRQALLSALFLMYKTRRLQALKALGPERLQKQVREKMVPEEWKRLGGPPFLPGMEGIPEPPALSGF